MINPRHRRIRQTAGAAFVLLSGALFAGCNRPLDPKDYGEVNMVVPVVEGVEKPYPLPKLEESQEEVGEHDQK